jgi:hypothetical protein
VVWTFHQVGERAGVHSIHSVLEDDIEQNSWGKSGSDWMCSFQNNGGLYRTSGDAPPESHDVGERAGIHSVLTNDFCTLEGWSEEDRAMLLIQSVQLT